MIFNFAEKKARIQLLIICIVVFLVAIFNSDTIYTKSSLHTFTSNMLPQGWSFFTKSSRDESLDVYGLSNGVLKRYTLANQSSYSFYGLSRKSRRLAFEASLLSGDTEGWKDTTIARMDDSIIHNILNEAILSENYDIIDMPNNVQSYKTGIYMLLIYKPIPYIYYKSNSGTYSRDIRYRIVSVNDSK